MAKIRVVTDSSADITDEQAKALNIEVIRMPLVIDEVDYLENIDINREQFIDKMKGGSLVRTSQATLGSLTIAWDQILEEVDEIIYLPLSSGLSGAYSSGVMLAKTEYRGRVTVLDLKLACFPMQMVCRQIVKCIDNGMSSQEIKELFESKAMMWATLIPEDIIYLKRGGRISPAAAALANLLKIVPILKVENGSIDVHDKVRTNVKAYKVAIEAVFSIDNYDEYEYCIVDAGASEVAEKLKNDIESQYPVKVEVAKMYPIIMAHTGPGTICIARVKKVIHE